MRNLRLNKKLICNLSSVLLIPAADVIKATGIANSTWYNMMQRPDGITIQQLLAIANGLHIPVRRLFSSGHAHVIGKRDDYIVEPYQLCRYDENTLHEFVNTRHDATWKAAAEMVGMSYSRLRNSLLAVTRTPVERFLTVCQVFDIDPFTILCDPNPELVKRQPRCKKQDTAGMREEIASLRENIKALSAAVEDLTEKYLKLLADHQELDRRVNINSVNIQNFTDSHLSIAADHLDPR